MNSQTLTNAAAVAAAIAAMPARKPEQWREQDLAAADVVELIAAACEGNGDAHCLLMDAVNEIRATVRQDRQRDAEEALPDVWPFPSVEAALL